MTPLGIKATLLGAAAFALLVPTFNALNAAHFEEVDPPFNLDPPENPPDVEDPPLGDENIELEGVPPPGSAGGCREFETDSDPDYWARTFTAQPSPQSLVTGGGQGGEEEVEIAPNVIGLVLTWGVENYVGQFNVALVAPSGTTVGSGTAPESNDAVPANRGDDIPVAGPQPGTWIVKWSSVEEVSGRGGMLVSIQTAQCKTPEAPPA